MSKHGWTGTLLSVGLALAVCERMNESEVKRQMEDLQEAKQRAPEVANDLQKQVEQEKGKLAQLEEDLVLARQGVTREVIEERKELKAALERQGKQVNEEVVEAEQASRTHSKEAEQASQRLQETEQPGTVETKVRTETQVQPNEQKQEVSTEREVTPIERTRVIDRGAEEQPQPNENQRSE